uniref:Beta-1,3-glucan-binding protein 1 n=1 Tax=Lygus hesperus TaxID=30085 RepID=A0A0A9WPT9_LYGHE
MSNFMLKLCTRPFILEITLEPVSTQTYGNEYSGRIRLAFARGNLRLMQDTKYVGNRHLEMGFEIGHRNLPRLVEYDNEEGWGRAFHNYTLIWTPDNLKFQVDDGTPEPLCFPGHPLYRALGLTINERKKEAIWERASNIAPFDKEFYISLGLSVGGFEHFPDNVRNSGQEKPWENHKAKALYNFWVNRAKWLGSWDKNDGKDSTMVIDYVKITSV